jgi:hypothetical protein
MKRLFKITLFLALIVSTPWLLCHSSENEFQPDTAKTYMTNQKQTKLFSLLFTEQVQDSISEEVVDSVRLRDPNYAIFVALVPGAVVHGAGHFYAGKPWTGLILFGSELAGFGLSYFGALTAMGDGEYSQGGAVAVGTGMILFFGSWVYDAVFAPLSIKRKNEELLREKHSYLRFQIRDGDLKLVTVWRF